MFFFSLQYSQKPTGYIFKIQASATDKNPTEPRSSLVELEIKVIESDKLAPTFDGELPPAVIPLLENETSVIKNIAILRAKLVFIADLPSDSFSNNNHSCNNVFDF